MVATRRATRLDPQDEGEGSAEKQTPEEVISPPSPRQTRNSVKNDGQTSKNSKDELTTSRSPLRFDTATHSSQITTRSRHRSGQSDANVSEAESCSSNTSTRRSRSKQILGQLTDSTRKLRSRHGSTLINEPITESKEDAELSEAESNCSSVSNTARRRQPRTALRSVPTRSRRSIWSSEPISDVSDAESNSSVSRVNILATRPTRNSRARHPSSLISEPHTEQTSDAESCSSGFSLQPLARRSSRRNKSNLQSEETELVSETDKDDAHETLKKQSHDVKLDDASSVGKQKVLSSPRRSLRLHPAIQEDLVIMSNDEPESSDNVCKDVVVEQPKKEESSVTREDELPMESSAKSSLQSGETQSGENTIPDQVVQLPEDSMDEEPAMDKIYVTKDNDAAEETNKNHQEEQETSINISLVIDSDSSENSEHSDVDQNNDEDISNMEVEDDNEQIVEKGKSKQASTQQLQDVVEDVLFVIDKAPGVDSTKKFVLESDNDDDDDDDDEDNVVEDFVEKRKSKKASKQQLLDVEGDGLFVIDKAPGVDSSKKFFLESDDDDDDDEDNVDEDFVEKRKSKKESKQQLQDVEGDGLFVIDTTPGLDSCKKYFLEPEDVYDKEDENVVAEREETPGPDEEEDDDDDDDFIDKDEAEDEDEEETLLNRPKKGFELSTSIDTGINLKKMGGLYINFDVEKPNPGPSLLSKMKKGKKKQDELLHKSVITPDFEKNESAPPYKESQSKLKKLRKVERDKTSGKGWFDMKAPEMTDQVKNDLKALKMRAAMDPKHFYKKSDREGFPKYFEFGTVVDNPVDFYHSRIPKKQRKRTIVEELLADSEFRRYNKKKYKEIIDEKAARAAGKKNRKKKKFRT